MAEFSFTYRAFISYSHADHKWAVWLHRALERYRVPRRLAGTGGLRRLGKMFRDEEELAAAAELGPKIEEALKSSDVLIVICSPNSARSKWVNQEIEAFKKLGREDRVFALIVDGVPHGPPEAECFPEALKHTLAGGVAEPLAVDIHKFGRADAALRLIAGMLGIGYDDLHQREVRRRRAELFRAQALFVSGLVLTVAALAGGYFAATNYVDASERTSDLFAREANTLSDETDYARAMLMALYGDPAAQAGPAERVLRPDGYASARSALVRGFTHNRLEATFAGHDDEVISVAFSPDGQSVLTGSQDGTAKLWSIKTGKVIATYAGGHGTVFSVAFSPDGTKVLTAGKDGTAKLWPVSGGAPIAEFPVGQASISAARFSPDGQSILTCSFDMKARLWRVSDRTVITTFTGHDELITSCVFSSDGAKILTGSFDNTAKLWAVGGGPPIATYSGKSGINSVALSNDGKWILTGALDGSVQLWPATGGEATATFEGHTGPVNSVAFSPDGNWILAGSNDKTATLWMRKDAWAGSASPRIVLGGHQNSVWRVAFSPDGEHVLTGSGDRTAKLWSVAGQTPIATNKALRHPAFFSSDGSAALAYLSGDHKALVPIAPGSALTAFAAIGKDDGPLDVSRDLGVLLTTSADKRLKIWSASGGEPVIVDPHLDDLGIAAVSPDGATLLTAPSTFSTQSDHVATLWPSKGGPAIATFKHDDAVSALAFSPDGKLVLTASDDKTAKLWRTADGAPLATFVGHKLGLTVAGFSSDGKRAITGAYDNTAKIWPVTGGEALATLSGHSGDIKSLAFSTDGRFVATGSSDGTAKLWSAAGGKPLATFDVQESDVDAVGFSPDGKTLLTGSDDFKVWSVPSIVNEPSSTQVEKVCRKLKEIGVTSFSDEDYGRFPLLNRKAPDPCAKIWSAPKTR